MGPQNPPNPLPEASKKTSWKKTQTNIRKESKSESLDLSKPCEGSPKSRISCFRKRYRNGPPKASIWETFWPPKSSKSRPGRVPKNLSKKGTQKVRARLQKGTLTWGEYLILGPLFGPLGDHLGTQAPLISILTHFLQKCLQQ